MATGVFKYVNVDKGFAFVTNPGGPDAFVHINDCADELLPFSQALKDKRVQFDVTENDRGLRAVNVRFA